MGNAPKAPGLEHLTGELEKAWCYRIGSGGRAVGECWSVSSATVQITDSSVDINSNRSPLQLPPDNVRDKEKVRQRQKRRQGLKYGWELISNSGSLQSSCSYPVWHDEEQHPMALRFPEIHNSVADLKGNTQLQHKAECSIVRAANQL
ncbi:hypothetical protein Baya_16420 [Bagarius yarrelli]|uniref:Uncharacterized protein n=1 Tax=Bagarius yarrelli TaxID=175774 RepID=A0A556VVD2_BAGYA|nr:hypothetical protein Baya_16420 [Bagarius yarrelli]